MLTRCRFADKIGADIGRQHRNHGDIALRGRSWHASRDRRVAHWRRRRASTNASRPEGRFGSAPRSPDHAAPGRSSIAPPPQTLGHAATLKRRLVHRMLRLWARAAAPVRIRHRDGAAPAFEHGAARRAPTKYQHKCGDIEDRKVEQRDLLDRRALRRRGVGLDMFGGHCGCATRSIVSWAPRWVPVIASGGISTAIAKKQWSGHLKNGFRRSQNKSDAGMRPGHGPAAQTATATYRDARPSKPNRARHRSAVAPEHQAAEAHNSEMAFCEQQRDTQSEDELGDFDEGFCLAEMPALIERPKPEAEVDRSGGIKRKLTTGIRHHQTWKVSHHSMVS